MAVADPARRAAPLGLRTARAPGTPPVARALLLQFFSASRPVGAPLPPALPGAPGARGPAPAQARAAGPEGGPAARRLGPGRPRAPRLPAQLGGRGLHPAQLTARPVCPPSLRALGAVDAAAILPGGLPGGRVGRGPRLAAQTARLPPHPRPPAALLEACLPSSPTLRQPWLLAHCGLGASRAQGQDTGAEHKLQGPWGAGRGQQGGLWDAWLPGTLHLEADQQLGIRSVRCRLLLFPVQPDSPPGTARLEGRRAWTFLISAMKSWPWDPSDNDVFHGQCSDSSSLRSWCELSLYCPLIMHSPSHWTWSHGEQWGLPALLLVPGHGCWEFGVGAQRRELRVGTVLAPLAGVSSHSAGTLNKLLQPTGPGCLILHPWRGYVTAHGQREHHGSISGRVSA